MARRLFTLLSALSLLLCVLYPVVMTLFLERSEVRWVRWVFLDTIPGTNTYKGTLIWLLLWSLPLAWWASGVVKRRRRLCRERRQELRLCPSCGYDLRATPGRCPECGTAAAGKAPPSAASASVR